MKFKIVHYIDVVSKEDAESLLETSADAIESTLLSEESTIKSEVIAISESP